MSQRRPPARAHALVIGGAALFFIAAWAFRWLSMGAVENDHFVALARAHQLRHGDWPVRDFADPGQPLTYLLSAAPRLYNAGKVPIPLAGVALGWRYADSPSIPRLIALAAWTAVAGFAPEIPVLARRPLAGGFLRRSLGTTQPRATWNARRRNSGERRCRWP